MLYIKALHIVFVVTWFSGMFYLVRLFIYNREAQDKSNVEKEVLTNQYKIMISRLLYGITLPSAIITLILGLSLLSYYKSIPPWLWLKFSFLLPLFLYHISLHWIWKLQKLGDYRYSSNSLRVWNEVATLFLIAIIFTAVVRDTMSFAYGLLGLIIVAGGLMIAIRLYKKVRVK